MAVHMDQAMVVDQEPPPMSLWVRTPTLDRFQWAHPPIQAWVVQVQTILEWVVQVQAILAWVVQVQATI